MVKVMVPIIVELVSWNQKKLFITIYLLLK